MLTPIDVRLTFDSAPLGLFSSANILQIADVALRVVFLLFLPCFQLFFRLFLTPETSEMSTIFCFHNQNNSTSSPLFEGKFIFSLSGHNLRESGKSVFLRQSSFFKYSVNIFIILYTIIHEISIVR